MKLPDQRGSNLGTCFLLHAIQDTASKTTFENWPFFVRYLLQYQEPIPCEQLVTALCDIKQAYTQFGGEVWWTFVLLNVYGMFLVHDLKHLNLRAVLPNASFMSYTKKNNSQISEGSGWSQLLFLCWRCYFLVSEKWWLGFQLNAQCALSALWLSECLQKTSRELFAM